VYVSGKVGCVETKIDFQQAELEHFKSILSQKGFRVTKSRLAVAETLIFSEELFLTPEKIHQMILDRGRVSCNLSSVYRTLSVLVDLGLVSKSEFYGEATQYSWRNSQQSLKLEHIHYFKCDRCQKVEPLEHCLFAEFSKSLAKRGFTNLAHRFEVTGICPKCRRTL
jgi:Fe2+ or Zn2+ uptake regulation protein